MESLWISPYLHHNYLNIKAAGISCLSFNSTLKLVLSPVSFFFLIPKYKHRKPLFLNLDSPCPRIDLSKTSFQGYHRH